MTGQVDSGSSSPTSERSASCSCTRARRSIAPCAISSQVSSNEVRPPKASTTGRMDSAAGQASAPAGRLHTLQRWRSSRAHDGSSAGSAGSRARVSSTSKRSI
jgi:hypothetical protein